LAGAAAHPVPLDGAAARQVLSDGAAAHPVLEDVGRDAAHQVRVFFSLCPLSFWLSFFCEVLTFTERLFHFSTDRTDTHEKLL
jgi:hypothetical protein